MGGMVGTSKETSVDVGMKQVWMYRYTGIKCGRYGRH